MGHGVLLLRCDFGKPRPGDEGVGIAHRPEILPEVERIGRGIPRTPRSAILKRLSFFPVVYREHNSGCLAGRVA
jgi:hypothetical protein